MRAILIDPEKKTVSSIYDEFQADNVLINFHLQADAFMILPLDERNHLFVDQNGPYRRDQNWWAFQGQKAVIAGRGLILGMVNEPVSNTAQATSANADVGIIEGLMEWIPRDEAIKRLPAVDSQGHPAPFDRFETMDRVIVGRDGRVIPIHG